MAQIIIVWGDPTDSHARVAIRAVIPVSDDRVRITAMGQFAHVQVTSDHLVSGPVIASTMDAETAAPDGRHVLVIHGDQQIPSWVMIQGILAETGWVYCAEVPVPERSPFLVDVLVLAPSVTCDGMFEGVSASLWVDTGVRPMQRAAFPMNMDTAETFDARVLESVVGETGDAQVILYTDSPGTLSHLREIGWWPEPWVSVRAEDWQSLVYFSDAVEVHALPLLQVPPVTGVTIHRRVLLPEAVFALLPQDVREATVAALRAMPPLS